MTTTIYATAGFKQYVGGTVTEVNGKDISSDTFLVGLSTSRGTLPTTWVTPDVSTAGASSAQRVLKLLIPQTGGTTPAAGYYVWAKISDSPEILPECLQGPFDVI